MQVEHVSVVSEISLSKCGVILWDHKIVSLEVLHLFVEVADYQSVGLIVVRVALEH